MRKFIAMALSIMFTLLSTQVVMANIPPIPPNRAVLDSAQILSPATVDHLVNANDELGYYTGGEVLFYTTHFVPLGQNIDQYALDVFRAWQLGHHEYNNGILVVIAPHDADNNYWVVVGSGIADYFTSATIERYLDGHFRPHFAVGNYDAAALNLFGAFEESIYLLHAQLPHVAFPNQDDTNWGSIIMLVVVIVLAFWIFSSISRTRRSTMMGPMGGPMMPRRRGFGMGGFWGGMMVGRGMANRQNRGGQMHRPSAPPPKPFGGGGGFGGLGGGGGMSRGGGGYTRGGGTTRGGGGGMSRGMGRRR